MNGRKIWIHEDTSDFFNREGFDYFGFDRDYINKDTKRKYNKRGFYKLLNGIYKNKLTKSEYDVFGYDIEDKRIDENGKIITRPESNHQFIKVKLNGKYIWVHEDTSDIYNPKGFSKNGISKDTALKWNKRGFSFNPKKQKYLHLFTNDEYDPLGYNIDNLDKDGNKRDTEAEPEFKLWKKNSKAVGRWINTETSQDFDRNGCRCIVVEKGTKDALARNPNNWHKSLKFFYDYTYLYLKSDFPETMSPHIIKESVAKKFKGLPEFLEKNNEILSESGINSIEDYVDRKASECVRILRMIKYDSEVIDKFVRLFTDYFYKELKSGNGLKAKLKIKQFIGEEGLFPELRKIIEINSSELSNEIDTNKSRDEKIRLERKKGADDKLLNIVKEDIGF